VPAWRLYTDGGGRSRLEPLDLLAWPFERGPGEFKGVGGAVLGDASRVMLMRFETGSHPPLHRAMPSFAVLLEGELVVNDATDGEVVLQPGDALRVEPGADAAHPARWRLGNRAEGYALLALVPMPGGLAPAAGEGERHD
jgi:hypothetical protein